MRSKTKWIQRALGIRPRRVLREGRLVTRVLPAHPGRLHDLLGVPVGQAIPLPLLRIAAEKPHAIYSDPEAAASLRKMAQLALRLREYGRKRATSAPRPRGRHGGR